MSLFFPTNRSLPLRLHVLVILISHAGPVRTMNTSIYSVSHSSSFFKIFIYLAVTGLSCGSRDLCCGMQDLVP